jgi:hypothetical protein
MRKDECEPLALSDRGERDSVEKQGESGIGVPWRVFGIDRDSEGTLNILVCSLDRRKEDAGPVARKVSILAGIAEEGRLDEDEA